VGAVTDQPPPPYRTGHKAMSPGTKSNPLLPPLLPHGLTPSKSPALVAVLLSLALQESFFPSRREKQDLASSRFSSRIARCKASWIT